MTVGEMEALARRWEWGSPIVPLEKARGCDDSLDCRMDTAYEQWKSHAPAGCLPCLLEELE